MASGHGDVEARFVEEDELLGRQPADPPLEDGTLGGDVRPELFESPQPFFFTT
jgi:hypothetical protein